MLLLYNTLVFGIYVIREREEVLFGLFIEKKMVDIDLIAAPAFLRMRRRRRKNELKFGFLSSLVNLLREDCCPLPVWLKMSRKWLKNEVVLTSTVQVFFVLTFQSVMNKVKSNIFDNLEKYVHLKMLRTIWCHTFKNACPLPFWKMIDKIAATGKSTVPWIDIELYFRDRTWKIMSTYIYMHMIGSYLVQNST